MKVRLLEDTAAALHARALPDGDEAELWVCRPTAPALVMGSAQRPDQFDRGGLAAAGIELAPRRSGGGAVWIDPDSTVWIDLLVPRHTPRYDDDLAQLFLQVGQRWLDALVACGVDATLFTERPERSEAARRVCWAGLGWGEVVVDGVKIVGLSQRRTRWGARVQGMAVIDGHADRAADWFIDADEVDVAALRVAVGSRALDVARDELERAVIAAFAPEEPVH